MASPSLVPTLGTWHPGGQGVRVDYSHAMLHGLAGQLSYLSALGVSGALGILLGEVRPDAVRVLDARSLSIWPEPGFPLRIGPAELQALHCMCRSLEGALDALQPVGFFCMESARTRVRDEELRAADSLFPAGIHVLLRLQELPNASTSVSFSLRDRHGLEVPETADTPFLVTATYPAARVPHPVRLVPPAPARRWAPWEQALVGSVLVGTFVSGAWMAAGGWARPEAIPITVTPAVLAASPDWSLRLRESEGMVTISWDPRVAETRGAREASLAINDGGTQVTVPLDAALLREGAVSYPRRSGRVQFALTLQPASGSPMTASAHLLAPALPSLPAPERPLPAAKPATIPAPVPAVVSGKPTMRRAFQAPAGSQRIAASPAPLLVEPLPLEIAPAPVLPSREPLVLAASLPTASAYHGPSRGRMVWKGRLAPGDVLALGPDGPSRGAVHGALPGVPVRIRLHPARFGQDGLLVYVSDRASGAPRRGEEAPGAQNGWNCTRYKLDPRKARHLSVVEAPSTTNGHKGVAVKAGEELTGLVVEWEVVQEPQTLRSGL